MKFRMLTIISVVFFIIISAGLAKANNELDSCYLRCQHESLRCFLDCMDMYDWKSRNKRCDHEYYRCRSDCRLFFRLYHQSEQPEQLRKSKKSESKKANLNKYFFFIYLKNGDCRKFDNIKISKNSVEAYIHLPTGSSSVNYSRNKILWIVGSDYKSYFENGKLTKKTKNKILNECGIGQ